jgi:leucyl aminopeptidase
MGGSRTDAGRGSTTRRGAITRALSVAPRFKGQKDELLPIVGPANLSVSRLVLAGFGRPDLADARLFQQLGGNVVAHLNGAGEREATFAIDLGEGPPIDHAEPAVQLAFGARATTTRQSRSSNRTRPWIT